MIDIEHIKEEIREHARRSAWVHVLNPGADEDAIIKDPVLLRLVWSEEDAKIMENYFHDRAGVTQDESQAAMDRGIISFGDFIDTFMDTKAKELYKMRNGL